MLPGNTEYPLLKYGNLAESLRPVLSHLAVRGRDIRMLSILEPGVAKPNFTPLS